MSKKKILFVVSDFYHNGAQREMYEFDNALDKDKFKVTILSLADLNLRLDLPDYFYERHLSLGTEILFLKDFIRKSKNRLESRILNRILRNVTNNKLKKNNIKNLVTLFDNFDKVIFMGEYVYQSLSNNIPSDYFKEIFIFIMCSRFQSESYRDFDKKKQFVFIGGFDSAKQIEHEFEGFSNYRFEFMPFCLAVTNEYNKWQFNETCKTKKIGIFTRLHKDKPLDPFLYAYQVLLSQGYNIELHVFGVGDYKHAEYDRYVNNLDLNGKVYFRGHQSDMKKTILEEKLDLVWFQGYNNLPAGFAALEVCLTGTPQIFWDFFIGDNEHINKLDFIYPHYKDLLAFVEASKAVLYNYKIAESLSDKQFQDIFNNRNVFKNVGNIEKILLE
ncbi:glycosyltransferase family 1 protein [Flavobacterium sp. AJR]|uniref:glycosyltransferase family 1 protein n=1 Tax=Flavobacterium sp. AJR TaxID=1979369 RepID=UPI000A3D6477|nr:glycosyltransferase family 1 protein [Flavobacterium sp. AJR]OUL63021.1 hypothetical protein B8T70_07135 [Flavobacterium sp. AJR]